MKLPQGYVPGVGVLKHTGGFGGFGQKMLEKMGWQRGQGLGKGKSGMKDAIEVNKKEDTLGIGATQTGWKWDWKYWEDAYNGAIQGVTHPTSGSSDDAATATTTTGDSDSESAPDPDRSVSNSGAGSSSSSDDSSDEDEPALERLMSCAVAVNRDGTLASGSAHELALAAALAGGKGSRGPAGRFGGREGKMARIRAQEERQAAEARSKLGITPTTSAGGAASGGASPSPKPSKKRKAPSKPAAEAGADTDAAGAAATDADSSKRIAKKAKMAAKGAKRSAAAESDGGDRGEGGVRQGTGEKEQQEQGQGQEGQEQQQRAKGKVIVVALKGEEQRKVEPFNPTPAAGWWGAQMFTSAGRLEGMEEEEQQEQQGKGGKAAARQRAGFDEDMQAALYNKLQAAQRQGKRGMGKAAVKIAGGNWEGKKTTFADEGDEGNGGGGSGSGANQAPAAAAGAAAAAAAAVAPPDVTMDEGGQGHDDRSKQAKRRSKSKKGKREREKEKGAGKEGKVKWVKLAVAELERAPKGKLRWSALWAALWEQEAVSRLGCGAKEAKEQCRVKLSGSKKLEVDGKKVKLVARGS